MDSICEAIIINTLLAPLAKGLTTATQEKTIANYRALKERLLDKRAGCQPNLADVLARLEAVSTSPDHQTVVVEEITSAKLVEDKDLLILVQELLKQVAQTFRSTQIVQTVAISNTGNAVICNIQGDQYLGELEQQKWQTP